MSVAGRMLGAHRASYMAFNQCIDLPHDISHVCHRKKCVNPAHLSHEEHHVNIEREICRVRGHCTDNHISKDGKDKTCTFIKCEKVSLHNGMECFWSFAHTIHCNFEFSLTLAVMKTSKSYQHYVQLF